MKKLFILSAALMLSALVMPKAQAYEPWGIGIYNGTKEVMDYAAPGATLG